MAAIFSGTVKTTWKYSGLEDLGSALIDVFYRDIRETARLALEHGCQLWGTPSADRANRERSTSSRRWGTLCGGITFSITLEIHFSF